MLIDRLKLTEILEQQMKLDMDKRGMQPSMVYGCFNALKVERTEKYCEKCKNYYTCELYLKACSIEELPFMRKDE